MWPSLEEAMLNTKGSKERLSCDEFGAQNDNEFVVKKAYLRKLKSMKKKFFVLRKANSYEPARLEYFGSEKKFKNHAQNAKRSIILKDCFSINRKCTSKSKHCIALYTNEDCVTLVFENENELNDWMKLLLEHQTGVEGNQHSLKPQYEHVWQVTLTKRGLGENRSLTGVYRLCLTAKSLLMFRVAPGAEKAQCFEFALIGIRRCGHTDSFFFIELGRSSCIGHGELWFLTEDSVTSHNMHEVILAAMKSSKSHEDFGPVSRPRSASTSENSKPIATRRPTSGGITSPTSTVQPMSITSSISYASITTASIVRDRCDSLPSRTRTTSEGTAHAVHNSQVRIKSHDLRPYVSFYGRTMSYSPPSNTILSPSSNACSTDSAGSSLSVDDYDAMTINGISSYQDIYIPNAQLSRDTSAIPTEPPISEEELVPEDYLNMDPSAQKEETSTSTRNISTVTQSQLRSSLNLSLQSQHNTSSSPVSSPALQSSVAQSQNDEGYIAMSPVGSTESTGYKSCSTRSSSIFERNSISSDASHGYVPMAPGGSLESKTTNTMTTTAADSEGYLDMTPLSTSLPKSDTHLGSSPKPLVFVPSFVSTKQSQQRAEEFRLDKVKSYLLPSEDDDSLDFIKPVRSYSMGSRPQTLSRTHKQTSHPPSRTSRSTLASHNSVGTPSESDALRVRAYSMGSKTTTSCRDVLKDRRKNSVK